MRKVTGSGVYSELAKRIDGTKGAVLALAFLTLSSNSSHAGWFEDAVKGGLGSIRVRPEEGSSANARTAIRKGDGKVHHVAVGVNGTFVKA